MNREDNVQLCIGRLSDDELEESTYQPTLYFKANPSIIHDLRVLHSPFFRMDTDWKELLSKIFNDWKCETDGCIIDTQGKVHFQSDMYKYAVTLLEKILLDCSWLNPHRGWSDQDWIGATIIHYYQFRQHEDIEVLIRMIEHTLEWKDGTSILLHLHLPQQPDSHLTRTQEELIRFKKLYRDKLLFEITPLFHDYKIPREYEGQVLTVNYIWGGLTMMEFKIIQNEKRRQGTFETCACDTYGLNLRTGEVFHNSRE